MRMGSRVAMGLGLAAVLTILLVGTIPFGNAASGAVPAAAEPPEIAPGTATITVKARFHDGKRPIGARCNISTQTQAQPPPTPAGSERPLWPTVVGRDGEWVIYNVSPGQWYVSVAGDALAYTQDANARATEVKGTNPISLAFTVLRGGSITGRVLRDADGQPVKGARVSVAYRSTAVTDVHGHYTLRHVAPGEAYVTVETDAYISMDCAALQVNDEATVTAPDVRLRPGGWISGHVVDSQDPPTDIRLWGSVMPRTDDDLPSGASISSVSLREDGAFRLGPLPPGAYTLEAFLSTGKSMPFRRWRGKVDGIRVTVGKETKNVVIRVSELKPEQ